MTATGSFEAKFAGICGECEQLINPGQQIERQEWQAGAYVHTVCPPTKQAEVCPRCFVEIALSGDCGCDA